MLLPIVTTGLKHIGLVGLSASADQFGIGLEVQGICGRKVVSQTPVDGIAAAADTIEQGNKLNQDNT